MPKPETCEFGGYVFYRYPQDGDLYFRCVIQGKIALLHRMVWEDTYGPIPKGYHIHHIDGDPGNCDISNLECLSAYKHISRHKKEWASTEYGKAWHKQQSKRRHTKNVPREYTCQRCGKHYMSKPNGHNKFCSPTCLNLFRRASGVDDIKATCAVCGLEFMKNKYRPKKTCSKACAGKLSNMTAKGGFGVG